jgi:hypothetical protein
MSAMAGANVDFRIGGKSSPIELRYRHEFENGSELDFNLLANAASHIFRPP